MATYTTTADVRAWIGMDSTADDSIIDTIRENTYEWITQQIGYIYNPSSSSRYFDAVRDLWYGDIRQLDVGYVAGITSITNGDGQSISSSDYVLRWQHVLTLKKSTGKCWTFIDDPEDAILITGSFGLPASHRNYKRVADLEKQLAAWAYRSRDFSAPAQVLLSTKGSLLLAPADIPPHLNKILVSLRKAQI